MTNSRSKRGREEGGRGVARRVYSVLCCTVQVVCVTRVLLCITLVLSELYMVLFCITRVLSNLCVVLLVLSLYYPSCIVLVV